MIAVFTTRITRKSSNTWTSKQIERKREETNRKSKLLFEVVLQSVHGLQITPRDDTSTFLD